VAAVALLFAASAAATVLGCAAMASHAQPMPGGWMLQAMDLPMCGQGAVGGLLAFAAMWLAMMVAMMLPSLAPALWRYRSMLDRARVRCADRRVVLAGAGYFATWLVVGVVLGVLGDAAGEVMLQQPAWSRAMPAVGGVVVVLAGVAQFSAWKRRHLACCRVAFVHDDRAVRRLDAWRDGVRLGLHCNAACANLTAVLLVFGVMDLRAMALVTAAVTAERLAPRDANVVRGVGVVLVGVGACLLGQALA
jgi:predicted metal-binding membrane protein